MAFAYRYAGSSLTFEMFRMLIKLCWCRWIYGTGSPWFVIQIEDQIHAVRCVGGNKIEVSYHRLFISNQRWLIALTRCRRFLSVIPRHKHNFVKNYRISHLAYIGTGDLAIVPRCLRYSLRFKLWLRLFTFKACSSQLAIRATPNQNPTVIGKLAYATWTCFWISPNVTKATKATPPNKFNLRLKTSSSIFKLLDFGSMGWLYMPR